MGRIENKTKHRRPVSETAAPSRGQRKRALKKASLLRKKGLVELTQRVSRDHETVGGARGGNVPDVQKKAVGGGDTLSSGSVEGRAVLRVSDHLTHHRVISNKSKRTLVATELGQLNDVLATPSFQQDPFTAVQAHLRQKAHHTPSSIDPSRDQAKSSPTSETTGSARRYVRHIKQSGSGTREDKKLKSRAYKGRNVKMRVKR